MVTAAPELEVIAGGECTQIRLIGPVGDQQRCRVGVERIGRLVDDDLADLVGPLSRCQVDQCVCEFSIAPLPRALLDHVLEHDGGGGDPAPDDDRRGAQVEDARSVRSRELDVLVGRRHALLQRPPQRLQQLDGADGLAVARWVDRRQGGTRQWI